MSHPVVHFEIIGSNPQALRAFFGELFDWEFDTPSHRHPGRRGGRPGAHAKGAVLRRGDDVEAALRQAEQLGGSRVMGPATSPSGLVVGHFTDPEGNLVGVAGSA